MLCFNQTMLWFDSNKSLLTPPVIKTKSYGSRSFQYAAVQLWNSLPEVVKQAETSEQFKTWLKKYLFTLYNNCLFPFTAHRDLTVICAI